MSRRAAATVFLFSAVFAALSCADILGYRDSVLGDPGSSSGGGGEGGTTASGGGTSDSGGATVCSPGAQETCYDGPDGTVGIGACKGGTQTCAPDGSGFGTCAGQVLPAVENCATAGDENCDGTTSACKGEALWAAQVASTQVSPRPVVTDLNDDVIALGRDQTYAYVKKFDGTSGAVLWTQKIPGANIFPSAVATDGGGNVLVAGDVNEPSTKLSDNCILYSGGDSDAFVAKFDPGGQCLWAKRWGDAYMQGIIDLSVDAAGAILMSGRIWGEPDFGCGVLVSPPDGNGLNGPDTAAVKLQADGTCMWSTRLVASEHGYMEASAVDAHGDMIAVGDLNGTITVAGETLTSLGSGVDVFIVKIDGQTGVPQWGRVYGTPDSEEALSVTTSPNGDITIGGVFSGVATTLGGFQLSNHDAVGMSQDIFLLQMSTDGAPLWAHAHGSPSDDSLYSVHADLAGNLIMTGKFTGEADFGGGSPLTEAVSGPGDLFVAKYTGAGDHIWSFSAGGQNTQWGIALASDSGTNIILAGRSNETLDFGAVQPVNNAFVVKFSP